MQRRCGALFRHSVWSLAAHMMCGFGWRRSAPVAEWWAAAACERLQWCPDRVVGTEVAGLHAVVGVHMHGHASAWRATG